MLTGNQVRVRFYRSRIIPRYLDVQDVGLKATAGRLLDLFRGQEGRTRGELEEDLKETFDADPSQLVTQGLAKLLEDRCDFQVVSGQPPDQIREAVFLAAGALRSSRVSSESRPTPFEREPILKRVAIELGTSVEALEDGMFADLKSEQRLAQFKDTTPERLLERYNVALAQAVLLRSTGVEITVKGESPAMVRHLLRKVKFHRLVCEARRQGSQAVQLRLDGPLSLFSATQKYGLQLAVFLPALLNCRSFELKADVLWGPRKKPATFTLDSGDGLVSHAAEPAGYIAPEMRMFVELFRKKIAGWQIDEESEVFPLGDSFWVPDYRLTEIASGRSVYLDVLGFWRKSSVASHLERLRKQADRPFLVAISEQLKVDEEEIGELADRVIAFRQMPLPDEVVRVATEVVRKSPLASAAIPEDS